jgi:hypothetical protein
MQNLIQNSHIHFTMEFTFKLIASTVITLHITAETHFLADIKQSYNWTTANMELSRLHLILKHSEVCSYIYGSQTPHCVKKARQSTRAYNKNITLL